MSSLEDWLDRPRRMIWPIGNVAKSNAINARAKMVCAMLYAGINT